MQKSSIMPALIALLGLSLLPGYPPAAPQKLAFASDRSGNGDIFILDGRGRLTNLTRSPGGEWSPRWSPDGRRLAFTGHAAGQADIWLMAADGAQPRNLTANPAWDYSPAWSPDGRQIVFVSERDGDAELFTQTIVGGPARQLTRNTWPDKLPSWSPGGNSIAFAAIINGREQIYRLDIDAPDTITPLLPDGLSGTNPVFSPAGAAIAFVGWQDRRAISLYTLNLSTGRLETLYTANRWLGSLSWSADGQWLFFTGRKEGAHNVMALNVAGRQLYQLTTGPAWDDFPALNPRSDFSPTAGQRWLAARPPRAVAVNSLFGYGVNLADLSTAYLIQDIHFNAIKGYINWATVEPAPGEFRWVDPDNVLRAAEGAGATTLLRVHGSPGWARPPDTVESHPPTQADDFARFLTALARRYRGRVAAYEIWNEPNLNYEWGYRSPSPAEYTALLKAACRAIKAADPAALVISAGPAPTGDGNPPDTLGDLAFIEGMYRAGAKGYFDALGSHIYTYGLSPDDRRPNAITFGRVAEQRRVMERFGDAASAVWITEMGWNIVTHWDLGEYHNRGVSQLEQAQYIRRAYEKIETDWPWVRAAYLFNLDFSMAPWYPAAEQMRWYAILNPDRTPRPAYTALRRYREGQADAGLRSNSPKQGDMIQ